MKCFNITIPDNKERMFLEWMKSISFVKKIEVVDDVDVPEEHKIIVKQRIQYLEEHPESLLNWEEVEQKISFQDGI